MCSFTNTANISSVSSLVTLAGIEGDKPAFEGVLITQIATLRKQLDKKLSNSRPSYDQNTTSLDSDTRYGSTKFHRTTPTRPPRPDSSKEYDVHEMLEALSQVGPRTDPSRTRFHRTSADSASTSTDPESRNFRDLLDTLSDAPPLDPASYRTYMTAPSGRGKRVNYDNPTPQDNGRERIREFMDNISTGSDDTFPSRLYSQPSVELTPPASQPDWSTTNPFARADNYRSPSSSTPGNLFPNLMWK